MAYTVDDEGIAGIVTVILGANCPGCLRQEDRSSAVHPEAWHVVAGNLQAGYVQLDFFTDYKAQEREERLQRVLLEIRQKYGPTAPRVIMKGKNMLEGATALERSQQIGGHRA